ncbi:MAG TPA: glycosyltransferase family 2 protein [Gemmatimonadales bacterium]|jgi:glycosyltransferase involved in cell wall biosynthesis|nr:glycosyltransferase family 2 protein [Gemmatimonadales bacterium]
MTMLARLSVAVPIFNEADVLPELLQRLGTVLDGLPGGPHEIVMVDDGSRDGSREALVRAAAVEPRLVVVLLSRNFGHQAALSAALDHVTGDAVVLMDGDLQDPPEAIPGFVQTHLEGYDVVYARRVRRKEGWLLRLCYATFYRVLARLSSVELPVDAGDFGLMARRVVDQLRQTPERHRYLRGLRAWAGYRQIGVAVERSARAGGESKYSLAKLVALACDGLFSFSVAPLRAAALLGIGAILLSSLYALYSVVAKLAFGHSPQGFTALIVVMTFLSGMNLLFLGLLGEYLGRVYEEVKRRPMYVVDQVVRCNVAGPALRAEAVVAETGR